MTDHPLNDKMCRIIAPHILFNAFTQGYEIELECDNMRAAANWQLEKVVNAWEDAFQSDLEHGVRSLNDRAARRLATEYPKIFAFGEVLAAMRPQQQKQQEEQ